MTSIRLEPGDNAPDFSLPDQDGQTVSLADFAGKRVVLYFYPKDNTPGCTKEACSFRDNHEEITATGAVVLGVSPDPPASHQAFAEEHRLPFTLLADEDHAVATSYGAWGLKKLYGREFDGLIRSTFIIEPDGTVAKIWRSVRTAQHGADVLAWLNANPIT